MANELARRLTNDLALREPRLPRSVERRVMAARYIGLEAAARTHAAAYVAHVALTHAAQLSAEEARFIQMAPLGEPRFRAIVDQFTDVACAELSRLAW